VFLHLRNIPPRLAAGGYLLHTGLQRWNGSQEQATGGHAATAGPWPGGVHTAAAGAFPFLAKVPSATFVKAVSVAEISVGAALLTADHAEQGCRRRADRLRRRTKFFLIRWFRV
jgi:hypothetical protein